MVQKQKLSPKQTTKRLRGLSKKQIFLLILLALVVTGCIIYALRIYQSQKRFAYAEQKKNEIVHELVSNLGDNVVSTRVQNECFEAEQVPYFGGTLWCQTTTIVGLKNNIDYPTLGKTYLDIGRKYGKTYSNEEAIVQRYIVSLRNGMDCNLVFTDSHGKSYGNAMDSSFPGNKLPFLAVACADRAAAKHYPYVNY